MDLRPMRPLSKAELAVNTLLLQGLSNKQIGDRLFVCEKTVKFHVTSILYLGGSRSRAEHIAKHYIKIIDRMNVGRVIDARSF